MHYLSSRRIVHRDVAARNVLLDAAMTCKVSDFGMSTALAADKDGSDYASNYVRMQGELPVRWSAIEVLSEAKYSKASDVWAYGILIFEVMSRGAQPYSEFATLAEVAEQIKSGYKMACPETCPEAVHATVMLPCWDSDPKSRPGFGRLCDVLVDLGAVPAEESVEVHKLSSISDAKGSIWNVSVNERHLLGPSVHHIADVLGPNVVKTIQTTEWKHADVKPPDVPENATILHTVLSVAKPAGATMICPRDGEFGCAYVDTLTNHDDVGRASALLSYTWGYKVLSVGSALRRWAVKHERNPKRAYVWICSLCLNQHRIGKKMVTPEELAGEFGPRVQSIGRILPMLEPWRNPSYLSRAWCLFELYTAIGERGRVKIDIILTEDEHADFVKAMSTEGCEWWCPSLSAVISIRVLTAALSIPFRSDGCIDETLDGIHSENATAFSPADLEAIRELIQSKPGGFAQLNSTVKRHLHHWFESQGAVRSAERIARHYDKKTVLPDNEGLFYAAGGATQGAKKLHSRNTTEMLHTDTLKAIGSKETSPVKPSEPAPRPPRPEAQYTEASSAKDVDAALAALSESGAYEDELEIISLSPGSSRVSTCSRKSGKLQSSV